MLQAGAEANIDQRQAEIRRYKEIFLKAFL